MPTTKHNTLDRDVVAVEEYLDAIADPKHKEHESFMEWRGPFDSEAFSAEKATKHMRRGLPNWREME